MEVVIFPHTLYLENVVFHENGQVKTGYVINGGWSFENRNGEDLAKAGDTIVTRYKEVPQIVIEVPHKVRYGGCNSVIAWAIKEFKKNHSHNEWAAFAVNSTKQGKLK